MKLGIDIIGSGYGIAFSLSWSLPRPPTLECSSHMTRMFGIRSRTSDKINKANGLQSVSKVISFFFLQSSSEGVFAKDCCRAKVHLIMKLLALAATLLALTSALALPAEDTTDVADTADKGGNGKGKGHNKGHKKHHGKGRKGGKAGGGDNGGPKGSSSGGSSSGGGSKEFYLQIQSHHQPTNNMALYACHEGAAIEGLCVGTQPPGKSAADTSLFTLTGGSGKGKEAADEGYLTWSLTAGKQKAGRYPTRALNLSID